MKRVLTTFIVLASFILMPFYPVAQAAVVGSLTATVTVPNVSATTLAFPALSGGASASATTTITIPALSGGIDGTASASATGTIDVTGTSGTTTSITVGATELLAASTTLGFDTDANTTAADVAAAINANTGTSGFSAAASGATITITAPASAGASVNGATATFSSDYLGAATAFSGGVTGASGVNATTTTSSFAAVTAGAGGDLSLDIGSTTIALTTGMTGAQAAAAVAAAINGDSSDPYTAAVVNTDQVELTAKASGAAGNGAAIASDLEYNAGGAVSATSTSGHFAAVATGTTTDLSLDIGSTTITLVAGETAAQAASTTAAAINADALNPYSASVTNTDEVTLTADAPGPSGNGAVIASDLSYNATAEVATFTPSNVTAGETYRITVNGTNYDVTATASSTAPSIAAALAPLVDADAAVSCTASGATVTCTASAPGTAFTASGSVLATTAPTLSPVTIASNNANPACAKAGDVVTLSFTSSHALATSTSSVLLDGATTTIVSLGGSQYSASFTANGSTTPGVITFSLAGVDTNGNAAATTTAATDGSAVTFLNSAPSISLNGSANVTQPYGSIYTDLGATSTNALGASVTAVASGSVNTLSPGVYTITYTATDCAGNTATTTRTVTVSAAPLPGGHRDGSGSSSGIGPIVSAIANLLAPITEGPAMPAFIQQVLGATTHRFTFRLKRGVRGDEILELQKKLAELGFYTGPQTGFFGSLTEKAVIRFQKAHGVPGTGFVGDLTIGALNQE